MEKGSCRSGGPEGATGCCQANSGGEMNFWEKVMEIDGHTGKQEREVSGTRTKIAELYQECPGVAPCLKSRNSQSRGFIP